MKKYYNAFMLSLMASIISLLFGSLYHMPLTGVVIDFDEQGAATIREETNIITHPKPGDIASESSADDAKEYFRRRVEWLKNNQDVVNEFQHKKRRNLAMNFSWIPWCFLALFMRNKHFKYLLPIFLIPSTFTLLGWFLTVELILMLSAYILVSVLVFVVKTRVREQ